MILKDYTLEMRRMEILKKGLGKGFLASIHNTWLFWVSMLNIWGVTYFFYVTFVTVWSMVPSTNYSGIDFYSGTLGFERFIWIFFCLNKNLRN